MHIQSMAWRPESQVSVARFCAASLAQVAILGLLATVIIGSLKLANPQSSSDRLLGRVLVGVGAGSIGGALLGMSVYGAVTSWKNPTNT
jgi:hypothetical protein